MFRRMLIAVFVLPFVLLFLQHARAKEEFTTSLQSRYEIGEDKVVRVVNTIRIKNNFSTVFVSRYAFEVSSENIQNIQVFDAEGKEMKPTVVHTSQKTSIAVEFADKIVGRDKVREFQIVYEHPDVSVMFGSVLEVDIPKLSDEAGIQEYSVIVAIPERFGDPTASTPAQYQKKSEAGRLEYAFGSTAKNGVNLLFGEQQSFRFSLRYNLKNPSVSQGIVQVALPPDTQYQRVVYESIDPPPERIQADEDGNWIATFTLAGQKEQTVEASGVVSVFLRPNPQVPVSVPDGRWLSGSTYWPVHLPKIQEMSSKLKNPRAIYNAVVSTLRYDYDRLQKGDATRRGAEEALREPERSLCQDFSDVFISLSRATGIPAREVTGFAYTENARLRPVNVSGDVLHSWPEYYDQESARWIPVDPTWQVTTNGVDYFSKLDFHHVAFAIRGLNPDSPYPAGMYKIPGQTGKDVQLNAIASYQPQPMSVALSGPEFSLSNEVTVRNLGGSAWYNVPVFVSSEDPGVELLAEPEMLSLLPFETKTVRIRAGMGNFWGGTREVPIRVRVGSEAVEYTHGIQTEISWIYLAIGAGVSFFAIFTGGVLVYRTRRRGVVRR